MPLRSFNRQQAWLLPPTLGELIPIDHPARFIAEFVDSLDREIWDQLEVSLDGETLGSPAYHPRALLSVWLYGFMTGVRSSRKLETACRDQVSYLWLTGWQHPDHNTLWRFYQAHRQAMRKLLKYTVACAVEIKLIDLAVQAIDGTKITANASRDRNYDASELQRLLERTETAITDMEIQNESKQDAPPPKLPEALQQTQVLRQQIQKAMHYLEQHPNLKRVNLTDEDAQLMQGRNHIITGYNAQTMVSPLAIEKANATGMFITAANVVNTAADSGQLASMLVQAEEMTGDRVPITLADGGYHTVANLRTGEQRNQKLVMTERCQEALKDPYFKDQFLYQPETDSYLCPKGQSLHFRGLRQDKRLPSSHYRVYGISRTVCRVCPAYGTCTRDKHGGRTLWIGFSDRLLNEHRKWMQTTEARLLYARRQQLSEPVFAILKDQMGARRFLLRGLANVGAEYSIIATAFNLKTLCRVWRRLKPGTLFRVKQLSEKVTYNIVKFSSKWQPVRMMSYPYPSLN
jgi:transposase